MSIISDPDIARLTNTILTTANALLRDAGRLFKPHGLTAVQFNVLHLLSDQPQGLRPSDLTKALVVDASSTTYVLDRMEALGWLRRADDGADRRAWRILLTPAGRALHGKVAPRYLAALRSTLDALPEGSAVRLADQLAHIQSAARVAVDAALAATDKPAARRRRR